MTHLTASVLHRERHDCKHQAQCRDGTELVHQDPPHRAVQSSTRLYCAKPRNWRDPRRVVIVPEPQLEVPLDASRSTASPRDEAGLIVHGRSPSSARGLLCGRLACCGRCDSFPVLQSSGSFARSTIRSCARRASLRRHRPRLGVHPPQLFRVPSLTDGVAAAITYN